MKHKLTTLLLLIFCCKIYANDTTIIFRKIKYSDVFEIAKKENKGVMLYFHFDGCGACIEMERTHI
jgi:hypothetical protein